MPAPSETFEEVAERLLNERVLSEKEYAAWALYHQQEPRLTQQEIAEELFIDRSTVSKRVRTANQKIGEAIDAQSTGKVRTSVVLHKGNEVYEQRDNTLHAVIQRMKHELCANYRRKKAEQEKNPPKT